MAGDEVAFVPISGEVELIMVLDAPRHRVVPCVRTSDGKLYKLMDIDHARSIGPNIQITFRRWISKVGRLA